MRNIARFYRLYCCEESKRSPLKKSKRDVFVQGQMKDVREDLEELMTYCANDVIATHRVTRALYPMYRARLPHPVSLAGMLEIGMAYLPTNSNWQHFLRQADDAAKELEAETLW